MTNSNVPFRCSWASGSSTDTLNYTYTNNNQLTGVTHTNSSFANQSFTWDANGNQTGTGYTTSSDNEQTASPGYTYAYDSDGNMTTMTQTSTGDVWTYSYNYHNQMTGATEKSSTGTVLSQTTYTYDALRDRIGMDENGTQTWTLFDGSDPVMDFNSSGSLTMRYLNGPIGDLVDAVLSRQSSGGTVAWYLPDRLGTVRDLMNTSGSIIDHVDYGAFGNQLGESSPANGDRMVGFWGMVRDTTTGLNNAVDRVENPTLGKWTSEDPESFSAGDSNLFAYAFNSPEDYNDPLGLGVGSWILTGQWNAPQNVWDSAMEGYGQGYKQSHNAISPGANIVLSAGARAPGMAGYLSSGFQASFNGFLNPDPGDPNDPNQAGIAAMPPAGPGKGGSGRQQPQTCPKGSPKAPKTFIGPTNPPQNPTISQDMFPRLFLAEERYSDRRGLLATPTQYALCRRHLSTRTVTGGSTTSMASRLTRLRVNPGDRATPTFLFLPRILQTESVICTDYPLTRI